MDRIGGVLDDLQPVARQVHPDRRDLVALGVTHRVVDRQLGHRVRRPHVREEQPVRLAHAVRALAEVLFDPAPRRLGWRVEDRAVHIEVPAVIAAADPAFGRNPELERRAAMRAVPMQETEAPRAVAKHHQVLAQEPHRQRRVLELRRDQERVPVAAQVFAARRARANLRQQEVVLGRRTVVVAAVGADLLPALLRCAHVLVPALPLAARAAAGAPCRRAPDAGRR